MFGMLLKDSKFKGSTTYDDVINISEASRGADKDSYRHEFAGLVKTMKAYDAKVSAK
jgi:Ca-activated chloride channel family protein